MQATNRSSKFFYGWIFVGVTALALLVAMGVRSAAGVFLNPMIKDTGWSTTEISTAVSIGLIMLGFSGPISGWLARADAHAACSLHDYPAFNC